MITLITGGPGSGKTLHVMSLLWKNDPPFFSWWEKLLDILYIRKLPTPERRLVYQHGIPGLKLPHVRVYCRDSRCTVCEGDKGPDPKYVDEFPRWLPKGAMLVVDEVQKVWRPRGAKSIDIPEALQALETSRHMGWDLIFMTQSPSLLDVHARRMVTAHFHIRAGFGGRRMFEWPETQVDVKKTFTAKANHPYFLNKKYYDYYKSADIHTKQTRKVPLKFILIFGSMAVSVVVVGSMIANRGVLGTAVDPVPEVVSNDQGEPRAVAAPRITDVIYGNSQSGNFGGIPVNYFDRVAADVQYPESAPAYSDVVEIVDYPRISGCMHSRTTNVCNCYLQSFPVTRAPVPQSFCMEYIANPPFNPYVIHASGSGTSLQ